MNAIIEQIKPETLAMIETQAAQSGLSIDEYLRRLLPHGENELGLKAETADEMTVSEESAEEKEAKRQKSIAWIKSHRAEYGGKYVALDGDKVIGIGERYGDALKLALQAGYKNAFIGDVLPLDYEGFIGGFD